MTAPLIVLILIPAYEPSHTLVALVSELRRADAALEVVVVDDGSGPAFAPVFRETAAQGATVLMHPVNRGKGAALRTGIDHVVARGGAPVVTADADGQHTVTDILRVARELRQDDREGTPALVLGCRRFTGPGVPARSRFGNAVARGLFRVAAGWSLSDTQTGLRGIPTDLLDWVRDQRGDRFEFEQNVLLHCRRDGVATREMPIETVYLERNASSHFRPVIDSARVMLPLLLFAGSSLLAFFVDTVAMLVLTALTGMLVPSIIAARVLSASVNFAVNRRVVFRRQSGRMLGQILRYALLAVALLASNVVWIEALTAHGVPLVIAKVVTEAVLFVTSYGVQRSFVFRSNGFVSSANPRHRSRIDRPGRMEVDAQTFGRNP